MFPFGWSRRSYPLPVAAEPGPNVREFDFVWRYNAPEGGQCSACNTSYKAGDALVAVGKRDCENRPVMHATCFEQEAA